MEAEYGGIPGKKPTPCWHTVAYNREGETLALLRFTSVQAQQSKQVSSNPQMTIKHCVF